MTREVERTDDGRYVVVDGRRWRTADPALPDDVRARLLHHLGVARVRRADGEATPATTPRSPPRAPGCSWRRPDWGSGATAWWEQDDDAPAGAVGGGAAGARTADRQTGWTAMQTFLPVADFADSARLLDSPRLGKQRVETLQILRAIELPDYGWANHPAVLMWRGRTPALVAYGLAMVRVWQERGFADTTETPDRRVRARGRRAGRRPSWPPPVCCRRGWATRRCTARTGPT